MGWFFGFRLHIVMNDLGEIMAVRITPGNIDDRAPVMDLIKGLEGKLVADKGYLSKELFPNLWRQGLHIITGIRKNMKNYLMPMLDKLLLRKRFIIEILFDKLKSDMGIELSRHRSPTNAFVHLLSCPVAYAIEKSKIKMTKHPLA
jgi:hypothetical protein